MYVHIHIKSYENSHNTPREVLPFPWIFPWWATTKKHLRGSHVIPWSPGFGRMIFPFRGMYIQTKLSHATPPPTKAREIFLKRGWQESCFCYPPTVSQMGNTQEASNWPNPRGSRRAGKSKLPPWAKMARQGGHILHSAMSFRQLRNVLHDKAKSCNPTTHQSKGDIFETWLARVMLLLSPHCFTDGEHPGSIKLTHLTMPPQLPLPHAALQRFRWYY